MKIRERQAILCEFLSVKYFKGKHSGERNSSKEKFSVEKRKIHIEVLSLSVGLF